jgi:hypothetical protein
MSKLGIAVLVSMLGLGISSAFAQAASGTMSQTEMASGTMAKHPMSKGKMRHPRKQSKEGGSMGMKPAASGAMGQ